MAESRRRIGNAAGAGYAYTPEWVALRAMRKSAALAYAVSEHMTATEAALITAPYRLAFGGANGADG